MILAYKYGPAKPILNDGEIFMVHVTQNVTQHVEYLKIGGLAELRANKSNCTHSSVPPALICIRTPLFDILILILIILVYIYSACLLLLTIFLYDLIFLFLCTAYVEGSWYSSASLQPISTKVTGMASNSPQYPTGFALHHHLHTNVHDDNFIPWNSWNIMLFIPFIPLYSFIIPIETSK